MYGNTPAVTIQIFDVDAVVRAMDDFFRTNFEAYRELEGDISELARENTKLEDELYDWKNPYAMNEYIGLTNPIFETETIACDDWRDAANDNEPYFVDEVYYK